MSLRSRIDRLQAQAGSPSLSSVARPPQGTSSLRNRLEQLGPERLRERVARSQKPMPAEALAEAVNGDLVAEGLIRISESLPLNGRIGQV